MTNIDKKHLITEISAYLFFIIVIVILITRSYNKENEINALSKYVNQYKDTAMTFKSKIKQIDGELANVTTQNALIVSDNSTLKEILNKRSSLKNVRQQVETKNIFTDTNIVIKYVYNTVNDTIKVIPNYIPINTKFRLSDKWFLISGKLQSDNIKIDTLSTISKTIINFGDTGFPLYKDKVELVEYNPYIKVQSMKNITLRKSAKMFGIGFSGGYAITKNGLSPYLGVGLSYNLIRF